MLLVVLIVGDPGAIDRRSSALRVFSIGLVGPLVFDALWSTAWLVKELTQGGKLTASASDLLDAGSPARPMSCPWCRGPSSR